MGKALIHKTCGGLVVYVLQWWEDWICWITLPCCISCGGPLSDSDMKEI